MLSSATEISSNLRNKMELKFWTLPKKIALTIMLAIIAWMLFGCSDDKFFEHPIPTSANGDTDVTYLERLYATYNEQYFQKRLPLSVKIDIDNHTTNIADTVCNQQATDCSISFNMKYAAAPRVAEAVMLHELCHIKLWEKHVSHDVFPPSSGSEFYHDSSWRSCMLSLDAQGAFRIINIDYYREAQ